MVVVVCSRARGDRDQPNGKFRLIIGESASETRPAWPRERFRLAFLRRIKCRAPFFRRRIFPEPVILKRFDTAFRVLAFPALLDMGEESSANRLEGNHFSRGNRGRARNGAGEVAWREGGAGGILVGKGDMDEKVFDLSFLKV
jgi:hypothetical protein